MRILFATAVALMALTFVGAPYQNLAQGVVPVSEDGDGDQLDRIEAMLNKLIEGQERADRNTDRIVEAILSLKQDPPEPEPDPTIQPKIEYQQVCENGVCRMVPYSVQDVTPVDPDQPMDPGPSPGCDSGRGPLFQGPIITKWRNFRIRLFNRRIARWFR